jgi:hypothetical protein
MNKIIIIIAVFVLMIIFNKNEYFDGVKPEEIKKNKCDYTTKLMSNINMYVDKICQDNSSTNRIMNNDRLTCRNFIDKQLYVGNDNKGWCDEKNDIPIKRLKGGFTGLDKLDTPNENPAPNSNDNGSESQFPFKLNMVDKSSLNLDNKKSE